MKTTRQQQDATRRQIVASAVDLMTRQGFDGTTMKDIARAAGIGDATIYKYFPTKDRIVLGYLDDVLLLPGLIWLAIRLIPEPVMVECRARATQWLAAHGAKPRSRWGLVLVISVWVLALGFSGWWLSTQIQVTPLSGGRSTLSGPGCRRAGP